MKSMAILFSESSLPYNNRSHVLHKKKPFPFKFGYFYFFSILHIPQAFVFNDKHPLTHSCISICKYCCFGYSVSLTFAILATVALSFKLGQFHSGCDTSKHRNRIAFHTDYDSFNDIDHNLIVFINCFLRRLRTVFSMQSYSISTFHHDSARTNSSIAVRLPYLFPDTINRGFPVYEAAFRLLHRDPQDSFHELP